MKYQNFIDNLKTGKHITVQDKNGHYQTISHHKDGDGNFRSSAWRDTKEEAQQYIGDWDGCTEEYLKKEIKNWEFIPPFFEPPIEKFEEGREVIVFKNAEDMCKKYDYSWDDEMKEMIGKKYKVKESNLRNVKIDDWWFPVQAVAYPMDEENEEQDLIQRVRDMGYNVCKK